MSGTTTDNCFTTAQSSAFHGRDSSAPTTPPLSFFCSNQLNVYVFKIYKWKFWLTINKMYTKTATNPTSFYGKYIILFSIQSIFCCLLSMLKIYTNNLFYSFNFSTYVLVASHVLVAFFFFSSKNWAHISFTKIYIQEFEFQFKIQTSI